MLFSGTQLRRKRQHTHMGGLGGGGGGGTGGGPRKGIDSDGNQRWVQCFLYNTILSYDL